MSLNLFFIKPVLAQPVSIGDNFAFGGLRSWGEGLGFLVNPAFQIAAVAVVIYFLVGAVKYILSAGNKEKVAEARDTIIHAIIGFMLLIFLFLFVQFIPQFLGLVGVQLIK